MNEVVEADEWKRDMTLKVSYMADNLTQYVVHVDEELS